MLKLRTRISRLAYYLKSAKFVAMKRIFRPKIDDEPHLDAPAIERLKDLLPSCKLYLEYGSGGSTVLAARHAKRIVSVESDAVFAKAVCKKIGAAPHLQMLTPKIGPTREWGFPIFTGITEDRVRKWSRYPKAPWSELNEAPDLILVDGRFRVACALESLLHAEPETCILVDDYVGRGYSKIEEFAELRATHGRMAEFRISSNFDRAKCLRALEVAYSEPG